MTNRHAGEVALQVDGKDYILKATHNSMAYFEELTGKSVFDLGGGGVRYVRALLLSMVKGQHGVSTLEDAGSLLDVDSPAVTKAVNDGVALFFRLYLPEEPKPASA